MEDYIPQVTSTDVSRIVRRDFPNSSVQIVMGILHDYEAEESNRGSARVQLAVLKLSNGSIEKLKHYLEIAKSDFRDVISPAEYPKFSTIGFVGVDKMSVQEREQLKKDDWNQYQQWLSKK